MVGMTQTPPSAYLASRLSQANGQPLPNGEALAVFTRRDDALAAFDVLGAAGFPVTALYLINEGVKQVEYPMQRSYGRVLLSALMWGLAAGLGYAALTAGDGSGFLGRAASTVPLAVAVFMAWTLISIRRGGNNRYPMRGEAVPERTTLYALNEYAGQARMILRGHNKFTQAMRAAHQGEVTIAGGTVNPPQTTSPQNPQDTAGTEESTSSLVLGKYARIAPEKNPNNTETGQSSSNYTAAPQGRGCYESITPNPQSQSQPNQQGADTQETSRTQRQAKPDVGRYGLRIDDPEEYAKTIRKAPARKVPKPKGVRED